MFLATRAIGMVNRSLGSKQLNSVSSASLRATGNDVMDTEEEPVPKEFYDLVDRFIGLANELTRDHATSRISSVILFAAARYNAHCMLTLDSEAAQNRTAATDYFVEQYRAMLDNNVDTLMNSTE